MDEKSGFDCYWIDFNGRISRNYDLFIRAGIEGVWDRWWLSEWQKVNEGINFWNSHELWSKCDFLMAAKWSFMSTKLNIAYY